MLRTFVALSWVLAGGCLLTTSLDGLEGPPVASVDDGGADAPTSSMDASALADVSSDEPLPDSGPKTCTALFCADFDESNTVTDGWAASEVGAKGTVALEKTTFVSAPHAFAASVAANSDFEPAALATYFRQPPPAVLHVDMNVYLDQVDYEMGGISFAMMGVETNAGGSYSHARVFIPSGTTVRLAEEYTGGDATNEHHADGMYSWPLQRWVHVRIDVTTSTISLTLDGTVYATLSKVSPWDKDPTLSTTTLKIGVYYSAGQQQRVVIDDVVLDDK